MIMDEGEKLLLAKIDDLFTMCERRSVPVFSSFLDGGEIAAVEAGVKTPYGLSVMTFGGYEGAERKIFGVFPEWSEPSAEEFLIAVLRVSAPRFRTLSHRDYLGTLMSLGIDRRKIGDILTDADGAYVFVCADIAEYIAANLNKIANTGVKASVEDMSRINVPKPETEERSCVCASLRLDAVVSAAADISRAAAEKIIRAGDVKLNHRLAQDRSAQVKQDDLLSVRGHGRFILKRALTQTRSGRLHIVIEKFV